MIDEEFLDMLACPACEERPPLRQSGSWVFCDQCHRAYPVSDETGPTLLIEEAVICENGEPPVERPS